jgi:hypothetical protein
MGVTKPVWRKRRWRMTFEDEYAEVVKCISLPCGEHCYTNYWTKVEKEGKK